ncbi:MAG: hypothetical protein M5U09_05315, partial [Gammaproteobacteria bacterium]|nr:hypothetical protein [Gammaproteobacteria bacterium]
MAAVGANANGEVLDALLEAGTDIDMAAANGVTALMLAAGQGTPAQVIYLLNAGADPTVRDAEGKNAADHARQNPAVRSSGIFPRLAELTETPFVRGWPSAYVVPVEGATISSRRSHLPGALRAYRNGYHEGFDFYDGTVSVSIGYGTPIRAVADGVVIRADHDYVENTMEAYDALIVEAGRALDTPPEILDRLRGRQVWIQHAGGFITRYAHPSRRSPKPPWWARTCAKATSSRRPATRARWKPPSRRKTTRIRTSRCGATTRRSSARGWSRSRSGRWRRRCSVRARCRRTTTEPGSRGD